MKKKVLSVISIAAVCMSFSLTALAGNGDKPLVWWNRQPSDSVTGELDMNALTWNDQTYYVGHDAKQGGELQGQMIADYIEAHIDTIDRNGDGIVGYVLAIGDMGHNDSAERTRGVRRALGTGIEVDGEISPEPAVINLDGEVTVVQDGEIGGLTVRELASDEMRNSSGGVWDADTADSTITAWAESFGDEIDVVVSNNDGMGMAMFQAWSQKAGVPTFGYDANSDAVAAIADGYAGTISQRADVQAYLTLRVLRNALDGADPDAGIGVKDEEGNVLSSDDYYYDEESHSYYALNLAVTADNYEESLDSAQIYAPVSNQLSKESSKVKKVWLNLYNESDDFLSSTYRPLLETYDDLLNLEVEYIGGDGIDEAGIISRLDGADEYDAYAINMVMTDSAAAYTELLK